MSILYLAAIASAVTLVPTQPDEPRKARVLYNDLNLSTSAGQQHLDRRLELALNMVCGRTRGVTLTDNITNLKCRKRAIAEIGPKRQAAIAKASGNRVAVKF